VHPARESLGSLAAIRRLLFPSRRVVRHVLGYSSCPALLNQVSFQGMHTPSHCRLSRLAVCTAVWLFVLASSLRADDLSSLERDAARLFSAWCLEQDLDLKAINQKATEARYEVAMDRRMPIGNGQEFIQKNWLVPSARGAPLLLAITDVTNGPLRVLGCSIYGPGLHGEMVEAELSKLPRMGRPTKHSPPRPEGRTVWWSARVGAGRASEESEVMMSRDAPNLLGVSINLIYRIQSDADSQGK
jgi:hypothetical protein